MDFFKLLPIRSWAYLGLALGLSVLVTWGVMAIRGSGVASEQRKHQVELAQHIERAAAQAYQIAMQDAEIINWSDNARTVTVFKTLWKEHETITYADCKLTPAGRVLYNRAIRYATDLSDTIEQSEQGEESPNAGDRDVKGNDGNTSPAHGTNETASDRQGSSTENVGSAWVIGGGY